MTNRLISLVLAGALSLGLMTAAPASQGSGCMPSTGTVSGLSFAQLVNQAFAALISGNSGASAPATDCTANPVKGQTWLDTSVTPNVEKRYDGSSWVAVGAIDTANHVWSPPVGGGMVSITASGTTDICAAPAAVQTIGGTTTVISFGSSCVVGARKTLIFNAATPITYNSTSMILPGQRSYTADAGDVADAVYLGSGSWRVISITKIDGSSVTNPSVPVGTILYGIWGTIPAKTVYGVGYALSRSSYPEYFAAATRVQSGTLSSGNATITSVANTAGLGQGMPVEGVGIQSGATIVSVTSSTIVMSATATLNGPQNVRTFITGYGGGGDSTTVGVTDCRGRTMAGRPDMGGGDTGRLATANFGTSALKIGAYGGSDSQTLTIAQMPSHNHGGLTASMNRHNPHNHSQSQQVGSNFAQTPPAPGSPINGLQASGGTYGAVNPTDNTDIDHEHGIASQGGGGSHPIVPPTAIAECVVVVQP